MTIDQERCARTHEAVDYVLGRLHGRRHESFARHLRNCPQCAEEVELLQGAADAVPLLAPLHVPPPDQLERKPERHAPTRATSTSVARPAPQPVAPRRPGATRLLKNPVPKPAMFGFVAIAIIAVVTIVLSHRAASTRYVHIRAGWSGGGAALQLQGDQLEVLVTGMPHPVAGEGYQVWVLDKLTKQLTPTRSWLHLNPAGQAGVKVPGDYHNWNALAVYVEPSHGHQSTGSGAVVVADLRKL